MIEKKYNWRSLNEALKTISEDEVKMLLDEEVAGPKRVSFLCRLHERYCMLRNTRERLELLYNVKRV